MEKDNTFINQTLPYEQLQRLGVSRTMADNLPKNVQKGLLNGEVSPLIQVNIKASNGAIVTLPVKLQVIEGKNGEPLLMAYPARKDISNSVMAKFGVSEQEKELLKRGSVISKDIDGNKHFLQMDPATKSLIRKPEKDVRIDQVLLNVEKVKDIELGVQQKQQAKEGKPIELTVGDTKVSVGMDLKEPQGFKIIKGDLQEWDIQRKKAYDLAHPEYVGLVQTDQNRWEYQKIVDRQSAERAFKVRGAGEEGRATGIKI